MRKVELDAVVADARAAVVFENVARFDLYPGLAPHVQSTVVHQTLPGPSGSSSWELHFRSGLLRWQEAERFHSDDLRIDFAQVSGDFEVFYGAWALSQEGPDTAVRFEAQFDFGIPSLEGILDPIAERVIRETVAWALVGLFTRVTFGGAADFSAASTS